MAELPREEQVAAAFVDLADTLVQDFDVIGFLYTLAEHCVHLLDVSAAGVLLAAPSGRLVDVAATDESTRRLETHSVEWGEGPCWDCFRSKQQITGVCLDTPEAQARWPRFTPRARTAGLTSVATCPLHLHGQVIGSLDLFRNRPGPLNASHLRLGQALANTATIGILQQQAVSVQTTLTAQLESALDSRVVVEQAKGYLAHRLDTDPEQAFVHLRQYARSHHVRLTDLARQVIQGTAHPALFDKHNQ
ncbi:GAF and ANTAR domain-containing protein [Streptomyces sp. NPDC060205]|uniref:GAF and ANTAR domain-containing protein n=1 Tax=Streptomyces sp. NPDC060205 TaxID=3347072 RepID=UPI0036647678